MIDNKYKNMNSGEKKIEKYIYSMNDQVGKGSFATVFRGRLILDDSPAAVKVIDRKIFANQYNLKNIHLQIQIMKKIEHPNIVKLLDVYQTNNNLYIVTEFCDEGDLRSYLKLKKKLTQEQALEFLKDIVSGFQYLNQNQIIHRDLKPANILLSGGRCKIADFGFAKNLQNGDNTILRSIVGTPLYMSPQLLNHQTYTSKSDLWSVGLIYYEMLHGYTPWPATNELQLINAIMNKPIVFDPSISEASKDFIRRCLKKKQEDRMSWEQATMHSIFYKENQFNNLLKNLKIADKNVSPRTFRERDTNRGRSKSLKKATGLSRTPTSRNTYKQNQLTPERRSPWRS